MLFQFLGLIFVFVAAYQIYKNAGDYGKSGIKWALVTVGVGLSIQYLLPFILFFAIGIILVATGTRANEFRTAIEGPAEVITYICLGLSLVGVYFVFKVVTRVVDEPEPESELLPPPPTFDQPE